MVFLAAAIAWSAPTAGLGSVARSAQAGRSHATLTYTLCRVFPVCHMGALTFSSSCLTTTTPIISPSAPMLVGPKTISSYGHDARPLGTDRFSDAGHFETRNGIVVVWSGTKTGQFSGIGHGRWTASNLPRSCVKSGSASGSYRSIWAESGPRATGTFTFSGFPGASDNRA